MVSHTVDSKFICQCYVHVLIYAVKGKEISIFLQIWTRKYVYIWNLTCTWSDTIRPCQNIHRNALGGQILNFQNTVYRAWNEIRMKIQTENFFCGVPCGYVLNRWGKLDTKCHGKYGKFKWGISHHSWLVKFNFGE
jgi:hypothetical protein